MAGGPGRLNRRQLGRLEARRTEGKGGGGRVGLEDVLTGVGDGRWRLESTARRRWTVDGGGSNPCMAAVFQRVSGHGKELAGRGLVTRGP